MLRLQAFQFELIPSGEQTRNLRQFAGSCRFVYNKALAINIERYGKKEKRLGYAELCALLPNWKVEHKFLSDVPAQAMQQSLKKLERAYTNFFQKRADFPKFKKKGQRESFRIPQGFEVDHQNGRVKVPKIGWMRYRKSRDVVGQPKNITISESQESLPFRDGRMSKSKGDDFLPPPCAHARRRCSALGMGQGCCKRGQNKECM